MIRDVKYWEEWESKQISNRSVDVERNLRIFQMLYEQAKKMGILNRDNPLNDMEHVIRIAEALNVSKNH